MKIATRVEGDFVVAYWAKQEMYGDDQPPLVIATFRKTALDKTPGVFDDWRALLRRVIDQIFADMGLPAPEWDSVRAPESERTGSA